MPILLLVGENEYGISKQLSTLKRKLDSTWVKFNYHSFSPFALSEALTTARSPALADTLRVVVVENCNFSNQAQFGERQLGQLQVVARIPKTTTLVFTSASIDKRLRIVKHLLQHGTLTEFPPISPWRTDLIGQAIAAQAKSMKLVVSRDGIHYLADAIGNDLTRANSELKKLKVYGQGKQLTKSEVEALVPCQTQNALQLAEAVRKGNSARAIALLDELLSRSPSPLVMVATLITQFRTWLWVKSAISDFTQRKDVEIAQVCAIGNPKRLYYLKQEIAGASLRSLAQAVILLFELELSLKWGAETDSILPVILSLTRLFQGRGKLNR